MRASGLHSNGYSLARHVLLTTGGLDLHAHIDVLGRTLGEEMLEPTRIYALDVLDLARADDVEVHAFSHVTGGGLAANLARVLPADLAVDVDRGTWRPPAIFGLIARSVEPAEMERTFNQGIGMLAIVDAGSATSAVRRLESRGVPAWVAGAIRPRRDAETGDAPAKGGDGGAVRLVGAHAAG